MATNARKVLQDEFNRADPTNQPQATTKADVNGQDTSTRLWQSLDYTYGKQREQSDKAYDKAINQQDNTLLNRGMQRSSYGMQTLANLQNEKMKANNDIYSAQIADYQNRLAQQDEAEAARQFQTSEREAQQSWQSGENALNRALQTSEREATQAYNTSEREATQAYNTGEREAQQGYNTAERIAQQIYNTGEREATQAYNTGEREATQAFTTGEREATQNWQSGEKEKDREFTTSEREASQAYNTSERLGQQDWQSSEKEKDRESSATAQRLEQEWKSGENAKDREQSQNQFDSTMAFNREQWEAQQSQWREEFDYNKMSDDQKLAYNYVTSILGNGGDPSDELLARAGLTRADANAMKAQVTSGGRRGNNPKPKTDNTPSTGPSINDGAVEEDWVAYEQLKNVPANSTLSDKTSNTNYGSDVADFFKKHPNK